MKFRTTDTINLRSAPSINAPILGKINAHTVVESDAHMWKWVTLPDGRKGYCAGTYLEVVGDVPPPPPPPPPVSVWHAPIRADKFVVTQHFLVADPATYPKTGHHPGTDYGTQGQDNVPVYFCADGEVVESGFKPTSFGNYFFYYVPTVDRTFAYFHLRDAAPAKGQYKAGVVCGVAGKTGLSFGIHLHVECLKGKKTSIDRLALYTSKQALVAAAEDADAFIRPRL